MTYMIERSLSYRWNVSICKDRSVSKIIPKFFTELTGSKNLLAIEIEDDDILEQCTNNNIFSFRWI